MKHYFALLLICLLAGNSLSAKDDAALLEQLVQEDSTAMLELAAYSAEVRQNIYQVATQPQALARLNDLQKKTQEEFRSLIAPYSKEEQLKVWNIVRYDGLISQLLGVTNKEAIENVLKNYPTEIHNDALNYTLQHHELLVSIRAVDERFNISFSEIISAYTPATQQAFRNILKNPEAISLLNNNMDMTVRLGDLYMRNAELVTDKIDALSAELSTQKAKEASDWKQSMQNDPEAAEELQQAATEYAKENGYAEDNYYNTDPEVVTQYVYIPYPYWAGYPWWYTHDYWYPYPSWYHSGFCRWRGNIFWYGPPSWYFINWHFNRHPHFYHYPRITNIYIQHYYFAPYRRVSRNAVPVRRWVNSNRQVFSPDFMSNPKGRPAQIRQYGKFEMEYEREVKNSNRNISRKKFYKQHAAEYPGLRKPGQRAEPVRQQNTPVRNPVRVSQPAKTTQPQRQAPAPRSQPPVKHGNTNRPVQQPGVKPRQTAPVTPRQVNPPGRQHNPAPRKK